MAVANLIYHKQAFWEIDYITHELCKDVYLLPQFLNTDELLNYDALKLKPYPTIFAFTSNQISFEDVLRIVININPAIIFYLSDEWGSRKQYMSLANHTKLMLVQYRHNHYEIESYHNIIQIPLGYMDNMFCKQYGLGYPKKSIADRKLLWSFVGNPHNPDRILMLDKFKCNFDTDSYFNGSNKTAGEMLDIYNNSVFVPSPRGQNVLDCFRLYEAIFSGAIPVIAGNTDDINSCFYYGGIKPPFVYCKSWGEAVTTCKKLLEDKEQLEKIQKECYIWLKGQIESIQSRILDVLN
jgi:hypothetical protein